MSRSTQVIGLNHKAEAWLKENAKEDWIGDSCPHCGKKIEKDFVMTFSDNISGLCGEEIPLYKYLLKDGNWVQEAEQLSPWSSGPMIFTALKLDGKWIKETLWTNKEVNEVEAGSVADDNNITVDGEIFEG